MRLRLIGVSFLQQVIGFPIVIIGNQQGKFDIRHTGDAAVLSVAVTMLLSAMGAVALVSGKKKF